MGQGVSCASSSFEHDFFSAVQAGKLEVVDCFLRGDPALAHRTTIYDRLSALHIAAANGCLEVLSMLLARSVSPDAVNRDKQTPLMLAAMHGEKECVQKLLDSGANVLMFDSVNGRTCLHYAAYYGHSDCLQAILSAAKSAQVTDSWGFLRFVNLRDGTGATPLHLASRQRCPNCTHILLECGALVCASTGRYGFPGSTPLHFAARGGNLGCVRELLSRGADRLQRDASGRLPYEVALKQNHGACAALLSPSAAEPLVWPSALKFISELDLDTKALLEATLMESNREREMKVLKATTQSLTFPACSDEAFDDDISEDDDMDVCAICFDRVCTIEVQDCRHQMCSQCTLALCCYCKPNPTNLCLASPTCPFCRSNISKLATIKEKDGENHDNTSKTSKHRKPRKTQNYSEGTNGFNVLSTAMGSFGRVTNRSDIADKL